VDDVEKYAISLVAEGGEFYAEDDTDEGEVFALNEEQKFRDAVVLGVNMARAVKKNPESFLAWYRSVGS
jgi:hypothetical protein